jgi:hypothetical protein
MKDHGDNEKMNPIREIFVFISEKRDKRLIEKMFELPEKSRIIDCTNAFSWGHRFTAKKTWEEPFSWHKPENVFNHMSGDGHLWCRPKVGDVMLIPMASGKVARYKVLDVKLCYDPGDMFFVNDSVFIGYQNGNKRPRTYLSS